MGMKAKSVRSYFSSPNCARGEARRPKDLDYGDMPPSLAPYMSICSYVEGDLLTYMLLFEVYDRRSVNSEMRSPQFTSPRICGHSADWLVEELLLLVMYQSLSSVSRGAQGLVDWCYEMTRRSA